MITIIAPSQKRIIDRKLIIVWKYAIDIFKHESFRKVKNMAAALKILSKRNKANIRSASYGGKIIFGR